VGAYGDADLKRSLLGIFYGMSGKYLQEYFDEFCYRFNQCAYEKQLPLRLLHLLCRFSAAVQIHLIIL
jgi:hypothetical protein